MTTTIARAARRSTRGLVATAVGALAAMTITACAGGDPLDAYLTDIRKAGAATIESDAALIVGGQFLCQVVKNGMDPAVAAAEDPASAEAVLRHCDTAFAQPLTREQRERYGVDAYLAGSGFGSGFGDPAADEMDSVPIEDGYSERGNTEARVGEEIETFGPPMAVDPSQWITVSSIEEHTGACPAAADGRPVDASENGSFHKVEMTVRTGPSYDTQQSGYYPGTAPQFDYVTDSGFAYDEVNNLPAFYCSGDDAQFYDLAPGRTYTGTVWVDLPDESGYLILGQTQLTGTGYEFKVG